MRPNDVPYTAGVSDAQIQRALREGEIEEIQTSETAEARVSIARHRDGSFTVLESENKSFHQDK